MNRIRKQRKETTLHLVTMPEQELEESPLLTLDWYMFIGTSFEFHSFHQNNETTVTVKNENSSR